MTEQRTVIAESAPQPYRPRPRLFSAAAIGVLALAAGHLVAGFINVSASPYLAVGNGAIDLNPIELKDFAVRTFGTYDKVVLLGDMVVTMIGVAALAGVLSLRSPMPGASAIVLFGLVGGVAVYSRPNLTVVSLRAPLASVLVGVIVFLFLQRKTLRIWRKTESGEKIGNSRRAFLISGAGVVAGAGVAGLGGQFISSTRDANASREAVCKLVPARSAPAIPADADFSKLGTPAFLTPKQSFYRVDTALTVPQVRTEDWSLRLHGMVGKEIRYSYDDIRNRPLVERTITMTCVSNEVGGDYVSTSNFIGVDLADLLDEAGVQPDAEQLFCTSVDVWTSGTPIDAARVVRCSRSA